MLISKKTFIVALLTMAHVPAFAEITAQLYGFAKVDYLYTDREFAQDQKPISVPSDAALTGSAKDLNGADRSQFSARHSRFGINVDNGSKTKGKFEFDMDGQSSSVTSAGNTVGVASSDLGIFRVRQANIIYKSSDEGTITLGKKWEIFSPLAPHSYQMTTIQFWAGNTGFITDGIDYTSKNDVYSWAVELKNATTNVAPNTALTGNTIKLSGPIVSARGDYKFMETQMIGLSAEAGKLEYAKQDITNPAAGWKNPSVSGVNLYYNGKFGTTDVVAEIYQGKNLGAGVTGALVMPSTGGSAASPKNEEMGYYVSVKYGFDQSSVYGGYGAAKLSEEKDAAAESFRSIASNSFARLGFDRLIDTNVTFYLELSQITTGYYEGSETKTYAGGFYDLGIIAKF